MIYEGKPGGVIHRHACFNIQTDLCDAHHEKPCSYGRLVHAYCYPVCATLSKGCSVCLEIEKEKSKVSRIVTISFQYNENSIRPVTEAIEANGKLLTLATGDRLDQDERELNVWRELCADSLNHNNDYDRLVDEFTEEHNWKNVDDWTHERTIKEIAKVWQPEGVQ